MAEPDDPIIMPEYVSLEHGFVFFSDGEAEEIHALLDENEQPCEDPKDARGVICFHAGTMVVAGIRALSPTVH